MPTSALNPFVPAEINLNRASRTRIENSVRQAASRERDVAISPESYCERGIAMGIGVEAAWVPRPFVSPASEWHCFFLHFRSVRTR